MCCACCSEAAVAVPRRLFLEIFCYISRYGVGGVGVYDYVGDFAYLRQGVAHGYGNVGYSHHGEIVEIVAEYCECVCARGLLEPGHRFGFRYSRGEYLYIGYVGVEYVEVVRDGALCRGA